MTDKKVVDIGVGRPVKRAAENTGFSGIVESIRCREVIAFSQEDMLDELKAVFGGDLKRGPSGEAWVENMADGETSDIGRLFNYMYAGRQFSRIEDVLVIALDMALEQIMHLRSEGIVADD